jgi:hypothetical protein
MNTVHIQRPSLLIVRMERLGKWYLVPPPSRAQVRQAIALDREDPDAKTPEGRGKLDERVAQQVKALAGTCCVCDVMTDGDGEIIEATPIEGDLLPFAELSAQEERELLTAIICWHNGLDPALAISVDRVLKKKAVEGAWLASAASDSAPSTPTPRGSPANWASDLALLNSSLMANL